MSEIRIACPLCAWYHTVPPLVADTGALASVFGPGVMAQHALNEHQQRIEEALDAHLKTHTTVEWVKKVTSLKERNDRLQSLVDSYERTDGDHL